MKWNATKPEMGSRRVVRRFLFLPKVLRGEGRWLEFVYIDQIWTSYEEATNYGFFKTRYGWRDLGWAEVQ